MWTVGLTVEISRVFKFLRCSVNGIWKQTSPCIQVLGTSALLAFNLNFQSHLTEYCADGRDDELKENKVGGFFMRECLFFAVSRYWSGIRLQWRLMRGNINKRLMLVWIWRLPAIDSAASKLKSILEKWSSFRLQTKLEALIATPPHTPTPLIQTESLPEPGR